LQFAILILQFLSLGRQIDHNVPRDMEVAMPQLHYQRQSLCASLDSFAASFASDLSADLRARVHAAVLAPFDLTCRDHQLGLSQPSCLALCELPQLSSALCLEVTPPLAALLLDRMLGGDDSAPLILKRPYTALELRLLNRVLDRAIASLSTALATPIHRRECPGRRFSLASPDDPLTLFRIDIHIGRHGAPLGLCIPRSACSQLFGESSPIAEDAPASRSLIPLTAILAETPISRRDLAALQAGDIITTDLTPDSPIALVSPTGLRLQGPLLQLRGHRALQITRIG
jgi:flagellar motor switch protein FliM